MLVPILLCELRVTDTHTSGVSMLRNIVNFHCRICLDGVSVQAVLLREERSRLIRHCGLVVSTPAWDETGCEFDSWQCRIYIPCSLSLRLLGSLSWFYGYIWLDTKIGMKVDPKFVTLVPHLVSLVVWWRQLELCRARCSWANRIHRIVSRDRFIELVSSVLTCMNETET